mgnify:FL=1
MKAEGRVFKFGDNVDTDVIIPARYLNSSDPAELATHCMEDIDKDFVKNVNKGDIIVANKNFGCGSSREHAPIAIKAAGVSCVIAETFARIFYRNAINIGLPIIENILQTDHVACSVLVLTFIMPVYNILGVLILSIYSGDMSGMKPGKLLLNILKNPMILAVIFGVLYAMTGLPLPYAAEKSLTYLGAISTPMALLMIGARMVDNSVKGEGKAIRLALLFKLILGPVVMTLLAIFLGMPTEEIVTVFVLFAVPTAMNVFIMTKSMGGDDGLAANAILASVPCSVIVMTIGIYLMRITGIV